MGTALRSQVLYKYSGYIVAQQCTILVTLVRCIVNCTAYPIQALCDPFPQNQGLGLKGLGWRFITLTERALKE